MAGMKLKNGADLCGFELRRFTIQNDSSDPTDLKVGRKYFNNGGGTAHLRERIYVGDKTITTDGWRDAAYMDDIKRLEGIIGSLDGNVGDNLLGLAEQLNAVQAKVDAFLEGDVDADAVLENLNELKQFLDTYSGDVTLSQVLNDINEEVAKKADKATTLAGYGIVDAVLKQDYINLNDLATVHAQVMGYGNPDGGWKAYSSGILSKVHDVGFALQGLTNTLFFRGIGGSVWDDTWHEVLHEDNYSNFLDSVYLKQSGGTIKGGVGALEVKRDFADGGSYILFSNTARTLGYIGVNSSMMPAFTQDGSAYYTLLHEGNYESIVGNKFLKLSGGTLTGDLNITAASQSPLEVKNTAQEWVGLGFAGKNNSGHAFITYNKNEDGTEAWAVTNDGWSKVSELLHSDNYYKYAPKLDGTGASGTWGIDISGSAAKLGGYDASRYFRRTDDVISSSAALDAISKTFVGVMTTSNYTPIEGAYSYGQLIQFADKTGTTQIYVADYNGGVYIRNSWLAQTNGFTHEWKQLAYTTSNVASATKLQTARSLWGNSFDGTADINGDIHLAADKGIVASNGYAVLTAPSYLLLGYAQSELGQTTYLDGNDIYIRYGKKHVPAMYINSSGNVTIGASDLALTSNKLYVQGNAHIERELFGANTADSSVLGWRLFANADATYLQAGKVTGSQNGNLYFTGLYGATLSSFIVYSDSSEMKGRLLVNDASDDGIYALQVNGAAKITGNVALNMGSGYAWRTEGGSEIHNIVTGTTGNFLLGNGGAKLGYNTYVDGNNVYFRYGTTHNVGAFLSSNGNVGIGTDNPFQKLHVAGNVLLNNKNSLRSFRADGATQVETFVMTDYDELVIGGDMNYYGLPTYVKGHRIILATGSQSYAALILDENRNAAIPYRLLVGEPTDSGWIPFQVKGAADIDGPLYICAHSKEGIYFNENGLHWHNTAAGWVSALFEFDSNNIFAHKLFKAQSGIEIPTDKTLKIGDATLSWDSVNNALKVDKNFYSTEEVSAGGIGSGTTSGGGGGTNNTKAFDIPIGTESMTFAHNLGTKDVIVAIYEISDSYQQVLADVIINNISEVTIMFGEATEVAHRVVIMG